LTSSESLSLESGSFTTHRCLSLKKLITSKLMISFFGRIPPGCPPIIAVLAANQYFEPAERVEAITLHAAELGINRLHLYVNAALKAGVGGEG